MNLFRLILLGCAGCHVSNPNSCHAIHHRDGGTGTLSATRSGLEVLHRSMRRSQRRPEAVSCTTSPYSGSMLERAQLPEGGFLSAIQASHVGLVYNLARRIVHTRGGGDWDSWKESSPFGDQAAPGPEGVATQGQDSQTSPKAERKLKMNNIIDQADDGEFTVQNEDTKAAWYQRYLEVVGGWPQEEEEPTMEQLSGVQRRLQVQDTAPYVDFAIFVPYGSKALRASKFRNYTLTASGYTTKDLPGPSGFIQWRACFRILRTTLIMLDAVSLAALHNYEAHVERLTRTFSTAWHLIYSADELARSSHSNRLRSQLLMDLRGGRTAPRNWDHARPWDWVFQQLVLDDAFWQTQVVGPALTWLAAGSRGTPKDPIRTTCNELHGRGPQSNHTHHGHEATTFEVSFKNVAKEKEAERTNRRTRFPRAKRFRRRRRKERKERQRKRRHQTKVFQLEQWYTTLRRFITGANLCGKSSTSTPLHGLQFTRPPVEVLPKSNAGMNTCGEGHGDEGQKKEEASGSKGGESEYSYTYETDEEDDQKDKKKEDEDDKDKKEDGGEGGNKDEPIDADSLEDYFRRRTFISVHHFAGPDDPLTEAMLIEAPKKKVLLKTFSVEKDKGTGDLLKDEPYSTHLRWAKRGYIDAYHSGFPCATFSRLKFREVEGLPGPVRTKSEPYGMESNSGRDQQACDDGTIMACRSINSKCRGGQEDHVEGPAHRNIGEPSGIRTPTTSVCVGAPGDEGVHKEERQEGCHLQLMRLPRTPAHRPPLLQAAEVRRHFVGHWTALQALWVRRVCIARCNNRAPEIKGVRQISKRLLRGLCKASHTTLDAHGQGRVPEGTHDEAGKHHKKEKSRGGRIQHAPTS